MSSCYYELNMMTRLQKQKNIGIVAGLGLLASWSGMALIYAGQKDLIYLAIGLILLGLVLWFWGVATYARAKGYPAILGICLALLLNILALLVLLVIPDKTKNQTTV